MVYKELFATRLHLLRSVRDNAKRGLRFYLKTTWNGPLNKRTAVLPVCLTLFVCCGASIRAQDYSHIRIVRLSFVEGNVQYQRAGEDWQEAKLNLPIQQGYAIHTDDGYAEVEFESGLEMRLANNSSVEFTELSLMAGGRVTRLHVSAGTAILDATLSREDDLSLAVSNLHVNVPHDARFRVDTSAGESWVTVFHGKVHIESDAGQLSIGGGRTLHENAADLASLQIEKSPVRDAFDKWVAQREQGLTDARAETSDAFQANSYTTGFADLDLYGLWADIPGYGWGWQPYGVGSGWMPFLSGQWMFMGNTGWNWVSAEPWGWLPYHFGGWVSAPGMGWLWVPHGQLGWQPATATWVQANNQVGWTPVLVSPIKPLRSANGQPSASSRALILASGVNGVSIKPGLVVRLSAADAAAARVVSPIAPVGASPKVADQGRANSLVNSGGSLERAPASFPAPKMSATEFNSVRPSIQAPRSVPVPRSLTGPGSMGFFNGGAAYSVRGSAGQLRAGRIMSSGGSVGAHAAASHSAGGGASGTRR